LLHGTQIRAVISVLKKEEVKAGDVVIRQGSPGDTFYLVRGIALRCRRLLALICA
jgi:CRP-like cAMP-binding protein